jgi:hypothetical protein
MVQSIRPLMIIPERSLVLRKYVSFWVIILFIILTAGCTITHEFGPFMGKVVDAESGEPVKGAVVLIVFSIESSSLGGSVNSFADAIETLTDAQGKKGPGGQWCLFWPCRYLYPCCQRANPTIYRRSWIGFSQNSSRPPIITGKWRREFLRVHQVTSQKLMVVIGKSLDTPTTLCYAHDV